MKTFSTFLGEDMRPLTTAELKKPNSKTGELRIEILRKAILSGNTPLTLVNNSDVVFKNSADNLSALQKFQDDSKAFELETVDGKTVVSSQLGKSPIFGGGAGAGGGTENTAVTEAAQCLWLAAILEYGVQPIEFYTPSKLKKLMSKVSVGKTTFEEMVSIDANWAYSAYYSAKALVKDGYVNKNHVFHRDSKDMNYIYQAKSRAFKNSELTPLTNDKWNPGDIWAIEKSVNLTKELDESSIEALNISLRTLFDSRKVVGISLKLVKKEPAKMEITNFEKIAKPNKFESAQTKTKSGDFFSNKGATVTYTGGKMEVRPNNYLGANKIEIVGKTARGGGAGWGVIIDSAKRYMGATVLSHAEIKQLAAKVVKGDKKANQDFFKKSKVCDASLTYDYFLQQIAEKDAGWCSAKLGAVEVCYNLIKNKGKNADNFVNAIVNYAASKSDDSSIFIKVYQ